VKQLSTLTKKKKNIKSRNWKKKRDQGVRRDLATTPTSKPVREKRGKQRKGLSTRQDHGLGGRERSRSEDAWREKNQQLRKEEKEEREIIIPKKKMRGKIAAKKKARRGPRGKTQWHGREVEKSEWVSEVRHWQTKAY